MPFIDYGLPASTDGGAPAIQDDPDRREGLPDGTEGTGAAAGAGPGARDGVPQEDHYDYEDAFIDDSEFVEYYGGDRRRARHSGFYVNKGIIEKVCRSGSLGL